MIVSPPDHKVWGKTTLYEPFATPVYKLCLYQYYLISVAPWGEIID